MRVQRGGGRPFSSPARAPHSGATPVRTNTPCRSGSRFSTSPPSRPGRGPGEAIRETLELARLADGWGYGRYWLAEHHNSESHAGSAPEMLVAAIAATTRRIRVGTAGVMLPHYSSLKVAEQFRVAEAVAPGRIDLGLGRAPGSDGRTAFALNPNAREAADRFPAQVQEVMGWLGDGLPEGHPFRSVSASPAVPTRPEVWILGSSDYGAQVAAYFGLPYCFAHFITERGSEDAVAVYREGFRPHPGVPGRLEAPRAALGVFALAADTEAEAWRLYKSRELWRLFRDTGRYPPLPSVEEAEAYPLLGGGAGAPGSVAGAGDGGGAGAGSGKTGGAGRAARGGGGGGADALPRSGGAAAELRAVGGGVRAGGRPVAARTGGWRRLRRWAAAFPHRCGFGQMPRWPARARAVRTNGAPAGAGLRAVRTNAAGRARRHASSRCIHSSLRSFRSSTARTRASEKKMRSGKWKLPRQTWRPSVNSRRSTMSS